MLPEPQDDDVKIIGHRRAPPTFRLPPPTSTNAEPIVISSDDEMEGPPAKRQKTTPAGLSSAITRNHPVAGPNTDRLGPLHIDLTIEELDEDLVLRPPPRKRRKPRPPKNDTKDKPILILDSDEEAEERDEMEESDSDYENIHDGFDIGWSRSGVEPDEHIFDLDVDVVGEAVAKLCLDRVDPRIVHNSRRLAPLTPFEATNSNRDAELEYMGASSFRRSLPSHKRGPVYTSYCGGRSRTGMLQHRPQKLQTPLGHLKLFAKFQMADGVHSISQSSTKILVASSTPGGTMDDGGNENSRVDPYNSRNTLALWTEHTREQWFQAHCALSPHRKYYDIRRARFDPTNSDVFVSTGLDGSLAVWKNMKPIDKLQGFVSSTAPLQDVPARYVTVKQWGKETFQGCCHDIIFRPQTQQDDPILFAAPCDNGKIFLHSYTPECSSFFPVHRLQISPHATHSAGATVWGRKSTSNMLFVCSEAENAYHGAFDTVTGKLKYHFDRHEDGEELALDPEGSTLALCTVEDHLYLHLYDVARDGNRRTTSITLPPPSPQLPVHANPEVGVMSWSPDGILLAVGCNDDVVHVYDVRCLERGPVLSLTHETRSSSRGLPLLSLPEAERTESKNSFGITVLSWTSETCFKSPRMGLLSGGGDHCVALWDIKTACDERRVVAELDGHVGDAHFGDLSKGEKPLVAGDTDGHIYIYDFVDRQ